MSGHEASRSSNPLISIYAKELSGVHGRVAQLLKHVGDPVLAGEPILIAQVQTAFVEVCSSISGFLHKWPLKQGDVIHGDMELGTVLCSDLLETLAPLATITQIADYALLHSEEKLIVFFVPKGQISSTQLASRFDSASIHFVKVSQIPRDQHGVVDQLRLKEMPMLSSSAIADWENILNLPLTLAPKVGTEKPRLHLNDLVESDQNKTSATETVVAHENNQDRTSNAPSISHGVALDLGGLAASIPALLAAACDSGQGIVYRHSDGREVFQSYAALWDEARTGAFGLQKLGLTAGDKVLLQLEDQKEYLTALWSCFLGGFVPVPAAIAPSYDDTNAVVTRIFNVWEMLEKPVVLVGTNMSERAAKIGPLFDCDHFKITEFANLDRSDAFVAEPNPADLAIMLMTSGSTGKPKLVTHTHQTLLPREVATALDLGLTHDDISVNWLPLDHVASLVDFHLRDIYLKARQVVVPTSVILADPLVWLELIHAHRATISWAPNFAYGLVVDKAHDLPNRDLDLSCMRHFINGGEAIVVKTALRFLEVLAPKKLAPDAMLPVWGMSETASGVTYARDFSCETYDENAKFMELGAPIPGFSLRIVDERDQVVPEGTVGRFQVRGHAVMAGYYQADDLNRESYTEEGWFRTGDLAKMVSGRLILTGREKDVIIIHGLNYYSHEIESVVDDQAGVQPSFTAACAVRDRDGVTDTLAIFFHTAIPDGPARQKLCADIKAAVLRRIGLFPEYVLALGKEDIPKTGIGKIQRSRLKSAFEAGAFDSLLREYDLAEGNSRTLAHWFFETRWQKKALSHSGKKPTGTWLIFSEGKSLSKGLSQALQDSGNQVVTATVGTDFSVHSQDHYSLDPKDPNAMDQLFEQCGHLAGVIHLWGYGFPQGDWCAADTQTFSLNGGSAIALLRHTLPANIATFFVSSFSQATDIHEPVEPERAAVTALVSSARQEYPETCVRHIDLPVGPVSQNLSILLAECNHVHGEEVVAWRSADRYVPKLARTPFSRQRRKPLPLRPEGIYVITGGLGGIGRRLAKELLQKYNARLLILGRSSLADKPELVPILNDLNASGGAVDYHAIDLCDDAQVQGALAHGASTLGGPPEGVFHLAGVLTSQGFLDESAASLEDSYKPKLRAAQTLIRCLHDEIDFFVAFSSLAGQLGAAQMSAYAAANRALDGFCHMLRTQCHGEVSCLAWGIWDGIGLNQGYDMKPIAQSLGYVALTPTQGLLSLWSVLGAGFQEVFIGLDSDHPNIASRMADQEPSNLDELCGFLLPEQDSNLPSLQDLMGNDVPFRVIDCTELPVDESGALDRDQLLLLTREDTDDVMPKTPLERQLAGFFKEILNVDSVSLVDNFFQMGGHSILALQLLNKVRDEVGVAVMGPTFLAGPTIAQLVEAIEAGRGQHSEGADLGLPQIVPDLENRHLPFPLNQIQQAYWIGRGADFELSGVSMHLYLEVDMINADHRRLERAWQQVIDRHDALRGVILDTGEEQIHSDLPPYKIEEFNLVNLSESERDQQLEELRNQLSHQNLRPENWPGFDIRLAKISETSSRLFISVAAIHLDGSSFFLVMSEWGQYYTQPETQLVPLDLSCRDYLLALEDLNSTNAYQESLAYWEKRIPLLPPAPALPMVADISSFKNYSFNHRHFHLDAVKWTAIKHWAAKQGISRSAVCLTAYAWILNQWTRATDMTVNVTLFNRLPLHPQINDIAGDFTSMVLVAVEGNREDNFETMARRVQDRLWTDLEHRHVNGVSVLRDLARHRRQVSKALMPVVFTSALDLEMRGATSPYSAVRNLGEVHYQMSQTPQVTLDCQLFEEEGQLLCMWDSLDEAFPANMLDHMIAAMEQLLTQLAEEAQWKERPKLFPSSQEAARARINATEQDVADPLMFQMFASQAAKNPSAPAVITSETTFSYGEVAEKVNRIAHWLREQGAEPNQLVALVMEKGWEQVVGALAIQTAGAAYLPMAADLPEERRNYLFDSANVGLVLTQSHFKDYLNWPDQVKVLAVDDAESQAYSASPLVPVQTSHDLAYVIFTSGSTGKPKGVMIEHRGATNTIIDINQRFNVGPDDRVFALSSMSFDLSVYDVFGSLAAGAAIVIPDPGANRDPEHWQALASRENVSIWNSVPALMDMWTSYAQGNHISLPDSLRLVMMSGDWIPVGLPDRIRQVSHNPQLISMGGATEASIWSIIFPIEEVPEHWSSIPYGKPMVNQRFFVLNQALEPCPTWVPGDLFIGGMGLARGYWDDEEKTNASFIVHPKTGERLYRTGDMGRYISDGNIEFLGREDFQVKIQGHRIELGDIETNLSEHPQIEQAVVVAAGKDRHNRQLVAHMVAKGEELSHDQLRAYLSSRLPSYMVPPIMLYRETLPLTPTGKVDRKALASAVDLPQTQKQGYIAPRNATEEALVTLWSELLGVQQLGVCDELLQLGCNSLIAINAVARIREGFQVELKLHYILAESATVASLAEHIQALHGTEENTEYPTVAPNPDERHESFPLNAIQEAYWIGRREAFELGNVAAYFYLEVEVPHLEPKRLEQAWQAVIDRHDMLRVVFTEDGTQQILAEPPPYHMDFLDLCDAPEEDATEQLMAVRERMSQQVLPTDRWPLFEFCISQLPDQSYRLHFGLDLLIADAWSVQILFHDLERFYREPSLKLKPLQLSFRDYLLAEQSLEDSASFRQARQYWEQRLDQLPAPPQLPLVMELSEIDKPHFVRRHAQLEADLWQQLKQIAKEKGLTPSGILLAAFAEVLGRWSSKQHLLLNVTTFNRLPLHQEADHIVGDFTSLNLLEVDGIGNHFEARAKRVQERLWEDLSHRNVSGLAVMRDLARRQGRNPGALAPIVFTSLLDGYGEGKSDFVPLGGEVAFAISQTPQVWLDHQVREQDGALIFTWDVIDELLPTGLPDDLFRAYHELLEKLATAKGLWQKQDLGLLPQKQAGRRYKVNATFQEREPQCLHHLFEAQASKNPQLTAVITTEVTMTYGEVASQVNRAARWLRAQEAQPNQLIAVVMEKGWQQLVGCLSILTAGSAYLPISPEIPQQRRDYLLANGDVSLVVTQSIFAESLTWPENVRVLAIDGNQTAGFDETPLVSTQGPKDLAYVIYTSGSTGRPKGVAIEHEGACNTILDVNQRFSVGCEDKLFALSELSFDLSVYDLFGAMSAGAAIVFPDPHTNRDPSHWLPLLHQHRVSVWNTVPALMDMLVTYAAGADARLPESLRLVLMSGDWIPLNLPDRIRAMSQNPTLISMGGATEASIWSIIYPIERVHRHWKSIPYGKAMVNQAFHVLNQRLEPCPEWVPGELYIGGIGLAREYWRDEEKTAASFITHPQTGERLYKTGDLGRFLDDGNIEFLGREDFQVKVQGHRIELGEIEAALNLHPGVDHAVVHAAGKPPGPRHLVAYVVAEEQAEVEAMQQHLGKSLPDYMIPKSFLFLDSIPLTANGKVDRSALPEVSIQNETARELPQTPLEKELAQLWCEVLNVSQVDLNTSFFELGGNSLMAIQMLTKVQKTGELSLRHFFEEPTVAGLAHLMARARAEAGDVNKTASGTDLPQLVPQPENHYLPFELNDIQQAYWMGRSGGLELGNVAAHFYFELELDTKHPERVQQAWQTLVTRHHMLRAVIHADGRQQILETIPQLEIPIHDLREGDPEPTLNEIRTKLSHQVMETDQWPLFEIQICRLGELRHRIHFSFDLLVADAWSALIIFSEFTQLYSEPETQFKPVNISFRDYLKATADLSETKAYRRSAAYWARRLPEMPAAPDLPVILDPSTIKEPRFERRAGQLSAHHWEKLQEKAASLGMTPSGLVLAVYAEVLGTWSSSPRFTVNVTTFNRLPIHEEVDELVGDFTSLTLLAVDQTSDQTFEQRARRIQEQLWEDLDHRYYSGIQVMRDLAQQMGKAPGALMPVVFTSRLFKTQQGGATLPSSDDGTPGEVVYSVSQTPQVWLDKQIYEEDGCLGWTWDSVEGLFPAEMIDQMFQAFTGLLIRLAEAPELWQDQAMTVVPQAQLSQINAINQTEVPLEETTLHELFLYQANHRPNHVAVISENRELTYGELANMSMGIAHWLQQHGVEEEQMVAVVMEKGWEQVVASLAIQISGGAYLPIDPDWPEDRRFWIMEHAKVNTVLTQSQWDEQLNWPPGVRCLRVDWFETKDEMPKIGIASNPASLAYVIFTSGSTGKPKGVAIEHRSAVNTIIDINRRYMVGPEDRVLAVSALHFDLSVYDIFGALAAGAAIVLPKPSSNPDPAHWLDLMDKYNVTLWNSVPALMDLAVRFADGEQRRLAQSLRLVLLSGDWLPLDIASRLRNHIPLLEVTSLGGATEGSIWSIYYQIEELDPEWASIPYGKPLDNQTFYVLDHQFRPRPHWVPGQLYIGGIGVAREYFGAADLTAAAYLHHPTSGERLYRTGDLGRYRSDGLIEFLGRVDFQVKVQGHRIELGEIEAVLVKHPAISRAVVTAPWTKGNGGPGDTRRLVAYLVCNQEDCPENEALQAHLAEHVPSYMVPNLFMFLEKLPLTANGKVDRKALPNPQVEHTKESTGPISPIEASIIKIWKEVLSLESVSPSDNFFDLGGNSLLALQLLNQLRDHFMVPITLQTLFANLNLNDLARAVAELRATGEKIQDREAYPPMVLKTEERYQPFPLTDVQQAYWIGRMEGLEGGNVAAHAYYELESEGLDTDAFEKGFQAMIQRHESLRIVIDHQGRQRILEEVPPYKVEVLDLRTSNNDASETALMAVRERMSHQVLSTHEWPIFEVRASKLNNGRTRLHLSFDLLISDAWSSQILFTELAQYLSGNHELQPLEASFRDYVLAEEQLKETEYYRRSREYWLTRIDHMPVAPGLPVNNQPEIWKQPKFTRHNALLPQETWEKLKERASAANLTASGLLLTAFCEVLARWSASQRFTINLTTFNRLPIHPQVTQIMGDFTSLTLLVADLEGNDLFEDRARRIQEQLWSDLDHRHMNGVEVMREMVRNRGGEMGPRAPIVFTSRLFSDDRFDDTEKAERFGEVVYSVSQTPQVWLDHQVVEEDGQLTWTWDVVQGLFPEGMIERMFTTYLELLKRLANEEQAWTQPYALIPEMNMPRAPQEQRPVDRLLHEPFLEQAAQAPDRLAVICEQRRLTYGELAEASNRIAHWLRAQGAKPDTLVGIVLEKNWTQIVAAMGVLVSGAAYLPIDPKLPHDRIRHLLKRGEVSLVLTHSELEQFLPLSSGIKASLAVDLAAFDSGQPATPLKSAQRVDHLAYVIFTSGSTGQPKGVAIEHRSAWNTIRDINQRFQVSEKDRVLAISSMSFDLSVYDVFGLLAAGGALALPRPGAERDPAAWAQYMHEESITLWNSVPALMEILVAYGANAPSGDPRRLPENLRLVMMSGDWIPVSLPDRIRAQAPMAEVISMGGATEASIWSIIYPIKSVDPNWSSIPYGKGMEYQRFYVLDDALQPKPPLVPGELYIGGIGLAREYWRDEQKTAASFVEHPLTGERLYRTGDHGRYLPDGNIEFMGRDDLQVKILGHRVELGEIEAALCEHPQIATAVVEAPFVSDDVAGSGRHRRLIAYVVPNRVTASLSTEARAEIPLTQVSEREIKSISGSATLDTQRLSQLLSCLRCIQPDGLAIPKYRYPSGGALYPVQVYLSLGTGAVKGLDAGLYAYHPKHHQLLQLLSGEGIPDGSCRLHFVGRLTAIGPLYPATARDFCFFESGYMAELIKEEAQGLDLAYGLSDGQLFEQLSSQIELEATDVHCMSLSFAKDQSSLPETVAHFQAKTIDEPDWFAQEIKDPLGKLTFKMKNLGYPSHKNSITTKALPEVAVDEMAYRARRSVRSFKADQVSDTALGTWLSHLRHNPMDAYLQVVDGKVAGIPGGAYRYNPTDHSLTLLNRNAKIDSAWHGPINRPIADESAFCLFLVSDQPSDALLLASGELGQRLQAEGLRRNIGICPLGGIDFQHVRPMFGLAPEQECIHLFLGGSIDTEPCSLAEALEEQQRVTQKAFSPEAATVTVQEAQASLDTNELQEFLSKQLPHYMVPSLWLFLENLPLSSNGKVDRKALPKPETEQRDANQSGVMPRDELERSIAAIVRETLGIERVGIFDNLFELGANSLQLVQLHSQLQSQLGQEIRITEIFGNPTVVALAKAMRGQESDALEEGRDRAKRRKARRKRR